MDGWTVTPLHEDCPECEHCVERATERAEQEKAESWSFSTLPSKMYVSGPEHSAIVKRAKPDMGWKRTRAAILAYARERQAYGKQGRTVGSARIASDLLQILDEPWEEGQ